MIIKESDKFKSIKSKIDKSYLTKLEKLIKKIINNPEIGKPMMHERKGTKEVYLPPFRLSYSYDSSANILIFLDIYHKKHQ